MTARLALLAIALLGAAASGCGFGGDRDKAGGSDAPTVLTLGTADDAEQPDARAVRYFAARVKDLSHGSLRVRIVWDAGGEATDHEQRIARMVRDGELDLGWIGARAWDELGITSFQALQAPFLVTNQALLGRIATAPPAARMLAGLERHGLVGLGLVPDRLRYPMGARHPLASLDDFAGARVKVIPSRATDALMRSLGATPVHLSGEELALAVSRGEVDGAEASLGSNHASEGESFVAPNVVLFAKALTLFAGADAFARLDDDQRAALRDAARQTVEHVAAHPVSESVLLRRFCDDGRPLSVVAASAADVAALRRAARPVYAELEREPQTRALIAAIRELKATTPDATVAPGCVHAATATRGPAISPSTLNGTYRWRLTKAGAIAAGNPDDPDIGMVMEVTLRDGRWGGGDANGSYRIVGDRIVFDWPQEATSNTFTFERRPNGDLDLEPVLPMDKGDQFNWASETWRRVGPPVRDIR